MLRVYRNKSIYLTLEILPAEFNIQPVPELDIERTTTILVQADHPFIQCLEPGHQLIVKREYLAWGITAAFDSRQLRKFLSLSLEHYGLVTN